MYFLPIDDVVVVVDGMRFKLLKSCSCSRKYLTGDLADYGENDLSRASTDCATSRGSSARSFSRVVRSSILGNQRPTGFLASDFLERPVFQTTHRFVLLMLNRNFLGKWEKSPLSQQHLRSQQSRHSVSISERAVTDSVTNLISR